jgi:hypothetical protein
MPSSITATAATKRTLGLVLHTFSPYYSFPKEGLGEAYPCHRVQ